MSLQATASRDVQRDSAASLALNDLTDQDRGHRAVVDLLERLKHSRAISGVSLMAADIAALVAGVLIVDLARMLVWGSHPFYWVIWPAVATWLTLRLLLGLYPAFGMPQPEELRRSVLTTVMAGAVHLAMLIAAGEYQSFRIIGLFAWLLTAGLAFFTRSFVKVALIKRGLYGAPFVVVGTGSAARRAIREMRADPELGMVPVAVFGGVGRFSIGDLENFPVLGPVEDAPHHPVSRMVRRALLVTDPAMDEEALEGFTLDLTRTFERVQILSNAAMPGNMWSRPRPLGPYLAVEVRQARFSDRQRRAKRLFDIAVSVPLLLLLAPFIGAAALAVKMISPGPAFFAQTREGIRGEPVRIFKIRSMVTDAEKRLAAYLTENPAARAEYEVTLKLRHDPRIIPGVGNFIRRTSIDELPQLFNIARGDMSLVGPRIMPKREVDLYTSRGQNLRRDVPPGLTGLWQVTSRNNSDLKVREVADSFYVSNWSVWLDGWILLRTVRVVLAGSGAY